MNTDIKLPDFISLGHCICILANPEPYHASLLKLKIDELSGLLTDCELHDAKTAATPLLNRALEFFEGTGIITPVAQSALVASIDSVQHIIFSHARQLKIIALNKSAVSQRLHDISTKLKLTTSQEQLLSETIHCLERGAHRAAVVIGWCFAYDITRQWIFDDKTRLQNFNNELKSYTKRNGKQQYNEIINYEDFFTSNSPAEGRIIEVCERAGLINGKVARKLRHYLDTRNDYAHATPLQPTVHQANAFLEHLLDIVTTRPPSRPR